MTIGRDGAAHGAGHRPRAAVLGSGVAGLTAAYVLQRAYDVTLYETDDRLGGHAHTHDVPDPGGRLLALDTGFLVHNTRTYPNLLRLFGELGVATQETEMSMSVSCAGCGLEYAGSRGARGLFPAPGAAARPAYLAMLTRIPAFYADARRLLATPGDAALPLGEFLRYRRYRRYFVRHFVVPLVAAVWSCPPADALNYPARYLFEFLGHHGMLRLARSPGWRTVAGGSRCYVEQIAKRLTKVATGAPVRAITRSPGGVAVHDHQLGTREFAAAVIATHPDQALRLLDRPTRAEREVLGAFRYTLSAAVLHTDAALLPRAPAARASWNYRMSGCPDNAEDVHVSYHLNRLQGLDVAQQYLVTLNPAGQVRRERVLAEMTYRHPVYDARSVAAQRHLPGLNTRLVAYAGAYHGWGFHEDGCLAGVRAAAALGVTW
jgi:predicted NAD/FAD-binding protein